MSRFLLRLNFDSNGCTDTRIANVGEVNFETESAIKEYHQRSAYFPPYSHAGLRFYDSNSEIKDLFGDIDNPTTIYFKYKIKRKYMRRDILTPIISYRDGNADDTNIPFLYFKDRKWLVIEIDSNGDKLYTRDISYTFDDRWHCVTITRLRKKVSIFIDGIKNTEKLVDYPFTFGDNLYLGLFHPNASTTATFNNGSLDDFCITDSVFYFENFVPPTLYWNGLDSRDNYFLNDYFNIDNLDPDLAFQMERNRTHTIQSINANQIGNIPYRMKIEWYTDDKYFINDEELVREINKKRDYTILRIFMVENIHMFVDGTERFGEWEPLTEVAAKHTMYPFALFVNKNFIPLSRIRIIKSDYWYTFIIRGLDPSVEVTDVKMLFIPFSCIYEEYRGERPDKQVMYSFKENGKFTTDGADFYYYFDNEKYPNLKAGGIKEEYINPGLLSNDPESDLTIDDTQLMHYSWRYGNFEVKRNDGTSTYVYFMAWDNGWIKPGDVVLLYVGNTLIPQEKYRIVGYDLIEIFDYYTMGLDGRLITMCIITDCRTDGWLFEDFTDTKVVEVEATENEQSVFKIPDVDDGDTIPYDQFLLFKGSVCLENEKRYKINYDKGTITLLSPSDWMSIGRHLTFVFVRCHKSDEWGPMWMKPIFFEKKITQADPTNLITTIDIPNMYNIKYTMNNLMVYNHNTLVVPQRYRIENNQLIFVHPGDGLQGNPSLIFVVLKMASQIEKDNPRNKLLLDLYRKGRRFPFYNLGIDKKIKLTLENITAFDQNGEYIDDLMGCIYSMNVIKQLYTSDPNRVVRYITIVYHDWSEENYANITLPDNDNFIKQYLCMFTEFEELDKHFDEFISEYETKYRLRGESGIRKIHFHYGVNLAKELDYQIYYNQSRFDSVYEKKRTVTRKTFNTDTLNDALKEDTVTGKFNLSIPQNTKWFINNIYDTYSLFFKNGELIDHEECVSYLGNECKLSLPSKLGSDEWMESIDCHKQLNKLEELPIAIKGFNPDPITNFNPDPYVPSGTNVYTEFNIKFYVTEYYESEDELVISVTTTLPSDGNIAINELPDDRIVEIPITVDAAGEWEDDLIDIEIETWTDPPPYVPPAGWKGPEYYDIYCKLVAVAPFDDDFVCSVDVVAE